MNGEEDTFDFFKKTSEALEGGWIFQGKKKHKVRIKPTCLKANHPSHLIALPCKIQGEKRGQKHLELHHSFFDSLGIPKPKKKTITDQGFDPFSQQKKACSRRSWSTQKTKPSQASQLG